MNFIIQLVLATVMSIGLSGCMSGLSQQNDAVGYCPY